MHISEGVLSGQVLAAGAVLAFAGTAIGLKKLDYDRIPQAAILSAAFFTASLIHVPVGPSSVHLILNGIVGLLLGWGAFPAIMIALVLQGVLFQFGGITTLGVNTIIMAAPAVICYYLFGSLIHKNQKTAGFAAFACGFFSVFLGAVIVGIALVFTEESFWEVASAAVLAHIPVMIIEGIITVFCISFLKKVQPELLPATCVYEKKIENAEKYIKTEV
ncbi:Metal transport protein domain-containing protein [Desulfonema limicola]|uniref:Metal transport protein domain-containing protein n=1 Tax=Desulfonema limicola TaxID=45656 RepID=A0A975BC45_9BACT|nr:cobalt transporter CbiM [Desulfonema limicola]QTA82535.1 Metal transport protein domain-containing protein [Desulfonema limicola]